MQVDPSPGTAASPAQPTVRNAKMADLGLRTLSASVLASIAVAALWAGSWAFAGLLLAISLAMSWEWGRLVRKSSIDPAHFVHGATVAGAVLLSAIGYAAPALIALIAGYFIVLTLTFNGSASQLSALGVLYVGLPAISLVTLRGNYAYGFTAVLFVIVCVIATDTCAYFAGRSIGGPKLWPSVSPKKTWSGLVGGVSAAGVVGYCFAINVIGSAPVRLMIIGLTLGLVAQGGDLAESALKRAFDMKDASGLIPGHGGFMDRMDGLVTAAVAAMLIGLWGSLYAPARALLLGF